METPDNNESDDLLDIMEDPIDWDDLDEEESYLRERWSPRDDAVEDMIDHADFEED